jgi:uncharacterized membrane protein
MAVEDMAGRRQRRDRITGHLIAMRVHVPSVSLSAHDHHSPKLRDRILAKLQASMAKTAYHILMPARLRALADIDSPEAPVLSLYLSLTPERRVGRAWHTVYSSMVRKETTGSPIGGSARL